jgi:hypothetical protein
VALLASRGALAQAEAPRIPPDWSDPLRQERPAGLPTDAELEAEGALVGEIEFDTLDVFDPRNPKEHNWFFRTANTLHVVTKESVLRRLLLFREGEPYSAQALAETERVLRQAGYLFDARVLPVAYEDGRVRVRVVTRDVWTLQVGVSVGRSGGENTSSFGVADSNLLGFGKEVTLERSSDVDRTSVLYRYRDPNIGGTRFRLLLGYQDNSDGFQRQFSFDRPFFSLSTRWSAGVGLLNFDRVDSLYTLGEVRDQFRHVEDNYGIGAGFSRGIRHGATRRFSAGMSWESDRFDAAPGEAPSPEQPENRRLVYPWVGYEYISDTYERVRNLDRIERTEDLNFGFEGGVQLGYSSESFGADRDQAILSMSGQTGMVPGRGKVLLSAATRADASATRGTRTCSRASRRATTCAYSDATTSTSPSPWTWRTSSTVKISCCSAVTTGSGAIRCATRKATGAPSSRSSSASTRRGRSCACSTSAARSSSTRGRPGSPVRAAMRASSASCATWGSACAWPRRARSAARWCISTSRSRSTARTRSNACSS